MKNTLIVLACVCSLGLGVTVAHASSGGYTSWLFGPSFQWNAINYGPDWKLVNVQTDQSTGRVLLFWQNTVTGEVAIHLHKGDTGFGHCHDAVAGIAVACTSGAVVD